MSRAGLAIGAHSRHRAHSTRALPRRRDRDRQVPPDEPAMPGPPQEPRFDQTLEQRLARRPLEPPQPLCLRDGQRQARHLAVLATDAYDELVEQRRRTWPTSDLHLLSFDIAA